jgi:hypothetical protein
MRTICKTLLAVSVLAVPLLAGALRLEVSGVAANPEAQLKHAVLVARTTACQSPEKTTITATAEGIVNGVRRSIPLKVISLATAGTFAVARAWPVQGAWALKLVATNPEYKDYSTGIVVPFENDSPRLASVQHYYHAPTEVEVAATLSIN